MPSSWTNLSLQANQQNILDGTNKIEMAVYL